MISLDQSRPFLLLFLLLDDGEDGDGGDLRCVFKTRSSLFCVAVHCGFAFLSASSAVLLRAYSLHLLCCSSHRCSCAESLPNLRLSSLATSVFAFATSAFTSARKAASSNASKGWRSVFEDERGRRSRWMEDLGYMSLMRTCLVVWYITREGGKDSGDLM